MGASVGIRPKADGENIVLTDTHRDLVDDVTATTDEFGTVLGEGINEIAATAKSANDSAGELAARVKVLEERQAVKETSASGTGWKATRVGESVELRLEGMEPGSATPLAEGFRPRAMTYIPVSATGNSSTSPRVAVNPTSGTFTAQFFTGKAYGIVSYLAK